MQYLSYEKNENKQKSGRVWPIFSVHFGGNNFRGTERDGCNDLRGLLFESQPLQPVGRRKQTSHHFRAGIDAVNQGSCGQNFNIDTVSNLVFWSRQVNKLEPWHIVYIMQH